MKIKLFLFLNLLDYFPTKTPLIHLNNHRNLRILKTDLITDCALQVTSKINDGWFASATLLLIFTLQEYEYNVS